MSERITEAELQQIAAAIEPVNRDENLMPDIGMWQDGDDMGHNDGTVRALVAEVRRLRKLIATLRFSEPVDGVLAEEEPGADWRRLIAEARAIREELAGRQNTRLTADVEHG